MAFSPVKYFSTFIASAQNSATFDLGGVHFDTAYLVVPTMASGGNISVWTAITPTSTFYEIRDKAYGTSTVQFNTFIVAASAAANGAIVPLPPGFQHYKLITDSAPTAATTFRIICS